MGGVGGGVGGGGGGGDGKHTRSVTALTFEERPSSRSLPSARDTTHVERPCGRFLYKARRKASDMKKKHEAECKTQPPRASLDGITRG